MFTADDGKCSGHRDFALSSVSGVSSASVVSLLTRLLSTSTPQLLDSRPLCPDLPDLDRASFFFGLGCGVLLRLPLLEAVYILRAALLRSLACHPAPGLTTGVVPLGPEVEAAPKAADCRGALFKAHRSTIRNVGTTSKRSAAGQVQPTRGPGGQRPPVIGSSSGALMGETFIRLKPILPLLL